MPLKVSCESYKAYICNTASWLKCIFCSLPLKLSSRGSDSRLIIIMWVFSARQMTIRQVKLQLMSVCLEPVMGTLISTGIPFLPHTPFSVESGDIYAGSWRVKGEGETERESAEEKFVTSSLQPHTTWSRNKPVRTTLIRASLALVSSLIVRLVYGEDFYWHMRCCSLETWRCVTGVDLRYLSPNSRSNEVSLACALTAGAAKKLHIYTGGYFLLP